MRLNALGAENMAGLRLAVLFKALMAFIVFFLLMVAARRHSLTFCCSRL